MLTVTAPVPVAVAETAALLGRKKNALAAVPLVVTLPALTVTFWLRPPVAMIPPDSAPEVVTLPTFTDVAPVPPDTTTPLLPSPVVVTVAAPASVDAPAPVMLIPLVAGAVVATVTPAGALTVMSPGETYVMPAG